MEDFMEDQLISNAFKNAANIAINHHFGDTHIGTVSDYKAYMMSAISGNQYELQKLIVRLKDKYPTIDYLTEKFDKSVGG